MTNNTDRADFIDYLENTLIPDLKESGRVMTAEDFETAVAFMRVAPGDPVTTLTTVTDAGCNTIIGDDEYSLLVEETGNTFLVLSSYLEQDVDCIVSPYGNGRLELFG